MLIEAGLPSIDDFIESRWRDNFEDLIELLGHSGIRIRRNEKLVRGLDYYNGTCFEIKLVDQSNEKQQNLLAALG